MSDDGVGVAPDSGAAGSRSGSGLRGLAERIGQAGGSLAAGPRPAAAFA